MPLLKSGGHYEQRAVGESLFENDLAVVRLAGAFEQVRALPHLKDALRPEAAGKRGERYMNMGNGKRYLRSRNAGLATWLSNSRK